MFDSNTQKKIVEIGVGVTVAYVLVFIVLLIVGYNQSNNTLIIVGWVMFALLVLGVITGAVVIFKK